MQSYSEDNNKTFLKVDMATVLKSVGEFKGEDGEDIQKWIDCTENICKRCGYNEEAITIIASLALRGDPKDWANNILREEPDIQWQQFRSRIIGMFSSQREISETVSRILRHHPK